MAALWSTSVPMTPEKFEQYASGLRESGEQIDTDIPATGTLSHDVPFGKATLTFAYDGSTLKLDLISCPGFDKPFVISKIKGWFGL